MLLPGQRGGGHPASQGRRRPGAACWQGGCRGGAGPGTGAGVGPGAGAGGGRGRQANAGRAVCCCGLA